MQRLLLFCSSHQTTAFFAAHEISCISKKRRNSRRMRRASARTRVSLPLTSRSNPEGAEQLALPSSTAAAAGIRVLQPCTWGLFSVKSSLKKLCCLHLQLLLQDLHVFYVTVAEHESLNALPLHLFCSPLWVVCSRTGLLGCLYTAFVVLSALETSFSTLSGREAAAGLRRHACSNFLHFSKDPYRRHRRLSNEIHARIGYTCACLTCVHVSLFHTFPPLCLPRSDYIYIYI